MRAIVVVGLGLGDEGKGSIVDYLVREHGIGTVVRSNGGGQAQHRVVLEDGRAHVFSQFGSGTFVEGARTFLSRHHLLNPLSLWNEHIGLTQVGVRDALERLTIDGACPVVTPFHIAANRLVAAAQETRHGTTGQGIGETAWDAQRGYILPARMLAAFKPSARAELAVMLRDIQERKRKEAEPHWIKGGLARGGMLAEWKKLNNPALPDLLTQNYTEVAAYLTIRDDFELTGDVVFEGAQGALLDEEFGFHPHTTWSKTTGANAHLLAREHGYTDVRTIGVLRGYATRHGEGPLVTEAALPLPEPEVDEAWPGQFRVGFTDLITARYAADLVKPDLLAVTCMDRLQALPSSPPWQVASAYGYANGPDVGWVSGLNPLGAETMGGFLSNCEPLYDDCPVDDVPHVLAAATGADLHIVSYGPTAADKRMLVT